MKRLRESLVHSTLPSFPCSSSSLNVVINSENMLQGSVEFILDVNA